MKIKIAVIVSTSGEYSAAGSSGLGNGEVEEMACEGMVGSDPTHTVWVTADVPVPVLPSKKASGQVVKVSKVKQ